MIIICIRSKGRKTNGQETERYRRGSAGRRWNKNVGRSAGRGSEYFADDSAEQAYYALLAGHKLHGKNLADETVLEGRITAEMGSMRPMVQTGIAVVGFCSLMFMMMIRGCKDQREYYRQKGGRPESLMIADPH